MNSIYHLATDSLEEKAIALKTRGFQCSNQPDLVSKVLSVRNDSCAEDEFNVWHAASDNNVARTEWGSLPTSRT